MKIGIVGLGLIGGSIGRATVKKTDHIVYAYDRDESALEKGALLNAYHEVLTKDNAKEIDLLLICVYPDGVEGVLKEYVPIVKPGAIVMDCVGIKRPVCALMEDYSDKYPDVSFVGGHPMAGREFSGVEHATAGLFDHATVLIVPVHTPIEALVSVKEFFLGIGADGLVPTTAEEHDRIIAYTSQLAHVVSAAYITSPTAKSHYGFSAGSFRDMTRVARLNPAMWTDLMDKNADFLSEEIFSFAERMQRFGKAIQEKDKEALFALLFESNETKLDVEKNRLQKRNDAMKK
ncbi:MAG: prephenate dehydrogenase/arogenate dehydrogenase family protein [Clostridia bacterium]|nr:prephenate dehydrogenase/arogenate dehydrogenase family protein [Clostridia bacterium]